MPRHDLVIIGAGPGGYIAALRAAQLGLDVACIEKEPRLGGTCLRVGCIPSKALLESSDLYHESKTRFSNHGIVLKSVELDLAQMMKRKEEAVDGLTRGVAGLFKKNKVRRYEGSGKLLRSGAVGVATPEGEMTLDCKHVILATGSLSAGLKGVEVDLDRIGTSTEALAWTAVPKHLVVIGAGVIGLELGSVWARLGSKVTVLEFQERILPGVDGELAKEAQRLFAKQGMTFLLGSRVNAAKASKKGALVSAEGREPLECDRVLLAVGRTPNTQGLGLEQAGVALDPRGSVSVDEHFATNLPGVFAIGDLIRGPMLAHKAEEEGIACVERIVTGHGHVNYDAIPNVVYTSPELASVGRTEEELSAGGVPYKKGAFPFQANARAKVLGHTEGRVKILAHRDTDRVLGVHILGARAGDLIAECTAAIAFGASSEDIARTCHAHPTLAEAVKEAALSVDGRALNI